MIYTFLSAVYANAENTAAEATTVEAGKVLLSAADTPDQWAALHAAVAPAPYEAPPASALRWTPLAFLERFAQEERIAIRQAAAGSTGEALQLADWLDLLRASTEVVADDPRTVAGMAALVAAGLLSPARRDAILTGGDA